MDKNKESFQYTYSARQQQEIRNIRSKYAPPQEAKEDKMELLRRLDRQVTQKAQRASISLGIIGTLIMGLGMSLAMTDLLGPLGSKSLLIGIPIGLAGILLLALAYPVHHRILKKERQRMAPQILRLTDELMQ